MTKRRKFLITAAVTGLFFWFIQYIPLEYREIGVLLFGVWTYGGVVFALKDDLRGVEWLTLMILPVMFSLASGVFYFLLPTHFLARIVVTFVYMVGMYAILLTENIYSVAAIRTIQLLRAAHAVGFLLTVLTSVLLFNALYSFHWPVYLNMIGSFLIALPTFLQSVWVVRLEPRLTKIDWGLSIGLSLMVMELAYALSFIPVTVWAASLFLGTAVYVTVGLLQQALQERLFERTIWEYVGVGVIVFIATLMITPWK